jgi:hypothetical protein
MKIMQRFLTITLSISFIVLTVAILSACSTGPKAVVLDGAQKDAVLAFSEPAADNMFAGMNSGDYAVFSRDFNAAMLKGIDEKGFAGLQTSITPKIGKYQTRTVTSVEEVGEFYRLTYRAGFEQDANVKVTLTFDKAAPNQVAGLFFNSDKLK